MRQPEPALALAATAVLLAGCATSALSMAPDRPDRPWTPATTPSGEIIPGEKGLAGGPGYVLPPNAALANVPPPPAFESGKVYSLPDLIDLAESNNPLTRIAWNEARRVALAAGIAESSYYPKITASAVLVDQSISAGGTALSTGFHGNVSESGSVSVLQLNWLLFDFGERSAVIDAVRQASLISNIAFTAAHQQLIYNVSLTFYGYSAAGARLTNARQSLQNARAVQAAAEDRYRREIGTVTEVAQARQATAQADLALVKATGEEQDAYLALISAMGISPLTKLKIADASGRTLSPAMVPSVENIVSRALSRRPDLLSAYAAEKASLDNIRAAQAEFLPKVFVSATGTYNSGRLNLSAIPSTGQQPATLNVSGGHLGGTILAGVTVPLYDGGTRAAALAQAHAAADNAEAQLTQLRNDAVRQIALADNALRTSLSAYSASQALQAAAQTTFDSASEAYRSGIGSITDVNLAQTQLLQARNATSDAYSAALSAAAALAFAAGALGQAPE